MFWVKGYLFRVSQVSANLDQNRAGQDLRVCLANNYELCSMGKEKLLPETKEL